MGKKSTKKLIQRVKKTDAIAVGTGNAKAPTKRVPKSGGKKSSTGKDQPKDGAMKFETRIARQQAALKRKRNGEKPLDKDASVKPKKVAFDGDAGTAKKAKVNVAAAHKISKDMTIDDFLAGGFEGANSDSDLSSLSDNDDSDSEMEAEKPEGEGQSESESESENEEDEDKEEGDDKSEADDDDDDDDDDDEEEQHKLEIEALKEKDPKFYKHLQEEDSGLLSFGQDDDMENEEEDEAQNNQRPVLTLQIFQQVEEKAFVKKTAQGLKDACVMFKQAAKFTPDGDSEEGEVSDNYKYRIVSPKVQQYIINAMVEKMSDTLDSKCGYVRNAKSKDSQSLPKSCANYGKVEPIAKRFLTDLLRCLKTFQDDSFRTFLLRKTKLYMPYVCSQGGKILRAYLQDLLAAWGGPTTNEVVRLTAFINIREMALISKPATSMVLRKSYLEFVRGCKSGAIHEQPRISFQAKCLVELFGIEMAESYQFAFVFIRELALHLRAAIISKTTESMRNIYSWQFLNCLRLWGSVLSAYPGKPVADTKRNNLTADEQQLRSLIYPLTQVLLGTVKLCPTSKYFPYRLHIASIIGSLARTSRNYIPVSHLLLDILVDPMFQGFKPENSTAKPPELAYIFKLGKSDATNPACHIAIVEQVIELLEVNLKSQRFSIAFPELIFPVSAALRNFAKKTRVTKWRSLARTLLGKLNKWSEEVKAKRVDVTFAPTNVERLHAFMSEEEENMRAEQDAQHHLDLEAAENADVVNLDEEQAAAQAEDTDDDDSSDAIEENSDASSDEDEEEEEEEEKSTKKPAKRPRREVKGDVNAEDVVEDFEMSSSEDDSE